MSDTPASPVRDKNYNLIAVVEASLNNAWRMEEYIQDAEREGDAELAGWFRRVQENSIKGGEQGKRLLLERLQRDES